MLSSLAPNQIIADRYKLVRRIGEGGMGEVWEGRHTHLDAPVAIKFTTEHRARGSAFAERFQREACAMARFRTPDIVQVFDAGMHGELPFLVMELLDGEPLRTTLERNARLSLSTTGIIVRQMARALAVVHRAGIVHRDMTPSNVFILSPTPEFPSLRSKLLDFGIAKHLATETRITTTGAIIGSPAYMSPEQARSEVVGVTSDLWSLGAVIFRCVTGVDAFQGKNLTEVLINICTGEAPRATLVSPELPNELNEFFERAFARNSNFRFGSALEMNAAFSQIIQSVPETNETVIGADDMSSTVRRFSQIPRTNTATILATQYPPKGWLRRTATSRRAIVGLSLAFGGIFGILATKGRGINNSHQSLPSFGSSTATTSTRLAPQSEKTSSNFVTERPSTPTIMSSSELAATTTQLPKVGTVRLRKKPSTPVSRTSSDIDPIFGLPEADK